MSDAISIQVDPGNIGVLSRTMRELGEKGDASSVEAVITARDLADDQTLVEDEALLVPTLRRLTDNTPRQVTLELRMTNGRRYYLPPPALDISTNDLCGLACTMCGNRATKRDPHTMAPSEVRRLIGEAAAWGIRRVALTGAGEPFRDPEMLAHIRFANSLGHLVTITSNGFPISEKVADELATMVLSVSISIHGATDATHDRIVGVPTAADHAWRALRRMVSAKRGRRDESKLSVNVSTVIQRENLSEIPDLVRRARAEGCDGINIQPVNLQHGFLDGEEIRRRDDLVSLSRLWPRRAEEAEVSRVFDELTALRNAHRGFVHTSAERLSLFRRYFADSSREALRVSCRVGEAFLAVDHRAQIKPCYRLPWSHGDARLKSVRALWNSAAYERTRRLVDACPLTCMNNCFFREGRAAA